MAWYQCSCGYLKEMTPKFGDTITSVIHLHHSARVDGTAAISWMEEISVPNSADLDHRGPISESQSGA